MSDEMESFERRLKRQPLQPVPAEWRRDILSAAREAQPARHSQPVAGHSLLSRLQQRLAVLLWPHPVAWGGLAAVWIFIVAANVSLRDQTPMVTKKAPSPSPEVIAEVQQQQRLFAELLGANDMPVADRPKLFAPKPRSENTDIMAA